MTKKTDSQFSINRRGFLGAIAGLSGSLILPSAFAAPIPQTDRSLTLYNTHTGEKLTSTYWAEGQYQMDSMKEIQWLLRDHRANKAAQMDPDLLDLIHNIQSLIGDQSREFHIISGYRSPETNAKLRNQSSGVAKKSFHMQGKAIDIRVPGYDIAQLRRAAMSLKSGGVGYYPRSNFIHVDTGRTRFW